MDATEFKCRWVEKQGLWIVAEEKRNLYWDNKTFPVDVELIIEKELSLSIEPIHNLQQQTDMDAYLKKDLSGIVVDYDQYMNPKFENRLRFSYAHELGHYFLHKYIYDDFEITSEGEWTYFMNHIEDAEYRKFEYQANEFAGRFLVSRQGLKEEINKAAAILKGVEDARYIKEDSYAVLSAMSPMISKKFGVSSDVIEMRIAREDLWPPELDECDV